MSANRVMQLAFLACVALFVLAGAYSGHRDDPIFAMRQARHTWIDEMLATLDSHEVWEGEAVSRRHRTSLRETAGLRPVTGPGAAVVEAVFRKERAEPRELPFLTRDQLYLR